MSPAPPPLLTVRLAYRVNGFCLDVALELGAGITAIQGPSGAGKSTLLDLIAGLRSPESGRVELAGRVLFDSASGVDLPPGERRIGYVFQDGRLFPHKSVLANLRYGYDRLSEARRRRSPDEVIELLELKPLLHRKPGGLSGGERQRVAIGRALLTSPELLLLDEPLTGLHPEMRSQITGFIQRVREELRAPMLYVTHRSEDLEGLAADLLRLDQGEVMTQAAQMG